MMAFPAKPQLTSGGPLPYLSGSISQTSMTDAYLATIEAELDRAPDAYGQHKVRQYARELLKEIRRLKELNEDETRPIKNGLKEPLRGVTIDSPMDKALVEIGESLLGSGCPCACVCHHRGCLTMVTCRCCENGNRTWIVSKGVWA